MRSQRFRRFGFWIERQTDSSADYGDFADYKEERKPETQKSEPACVQGVSGDLRAVIEVWDILPPALQAGIVAMGKAAVASERPKRKKA